MQQRLVIDGQPVSQNTARIPTGQGKEVLAIQVQHVLQEA